jgi:cytochrome c-type biogenesis protein CcmH/NrfG
MPGEAQDRAAAAMATEHLLTGDGHYYQGRYADAEAAYREAIRLDPLRAAARTRLGHVLHKTKRLAKAEAAYREAIRLDPDDARAHECLEQLLQARKGRRR